MHTSASLGPCTWNKWDKTVKYRVVPQIKWNDKSIEHNRKVHKLPITKEYMLKEYSDVFKGIGTLPGGPYHIRLKENYRPVQHPLRSVPVAMQAAYRAELDRLTKEGIFTEVQEHTEWINFIVLVMKPNGSLRLCLDPKDLNKAIKRNQWYSRTIDDILPKLANSKYNMLKDSVSGYWHVVLDLASSLLTTFNTPWGKLRWLRLPFRTENIEWCLPRKAWQSTQTTQWCPWNCQWHTHTWRNWDSAWWLVTDTPWDSHNEQSITQPQQDPVQIHRLQVLWTPGSLLKDSGQTQKKSKP